jgi:hypothetical protein
VFSIDSDTTNDACSLDVDGQTVHFDHAGSCVIDADQAGDGNHNAADTVQQTLTVANVVVVPQGFGVAKTRDGRVAIGGGGGGRYVFARKTLSTPAVAAVPAAGGPATPLIVALGADHKLHVRGNAGRWQTLSTQQCFGSPAALVLHHRLFVACTSSKGHLLAGSVKLPSSGLPTIAKFHDLGGQVHGGPAIAKWDGAVTYFITAAHHRLESRTRHSDYQEQSLRCTSRPAAGNTVAGKNGALACRAPDGSLVAVTDATGFDAPIHLGGVVKGSPGVVVTSTATYYLRQGAHHKPYFGTADTGWTKAFGHVVGGIQGVGRT